MIAVLIIPTGIGCPIGGHAGDANPVAKLIGACCDKVILHPNVVNASDINEMPDNALYVEGSVLDRFLNGYVRLKEVTKPNRILLVTNSPAHTETINAASAARATVGADVRVMELNIPLRMVARYDVHGLAVGDVEGWEELCIQVQLQGGIFDALAIASAVQVDEEIERKYWKEGGVNPWGGVEAMVSRLVSERIGKPVAHAPVIEKEIVDIDLTESNIVVDPRQSAEIISWAMIHCVLKGLHRAPSIIHQCENGFYEYHFRSIGFEDVNVMISPFGCWGRPHEACVKNKIPIIFVTENKCLVSNLKLSKLQDGIGIIVQNYWEATGLLMSMKAGIIPESVRRPLEATKVIRKEKDNG